MIIQRKVLLLIVMVSLMGAGASPSPRQGQMTRNPLLPDWVRPGLRLTYDLLTGGVNRSADELRWNEDTKSWEPANVDRGYVTRGKDYAIYEGEYSSHGLVQATVAGLDGQVVALSQPFYLLSPTGRQPILMPGANQDMLVTADTGGDFWMHPQKQAQMLRLYAAAGGQIVARTTTWVEGPQSYTATTMLSQSPSGKTLYVYDQASGRLLYLSRLTREPPDLQQNRIHDPSSPLKRRPVSYATFMRFVAARQMNLPWMDSPMPDWSRQAQAFSYAGRQGTQAPGVNTSQALMQELRVERRGGNWTLFQAFSQAQWQMATGPGAKVVTGPGLLSPLIIPPAGLALLQPGQEIDRDPLTGFVARVAAADQQTVTLQIDGPDRSMMYVYSRAQGTLIRSVSRERGAGQNMVLTREMQLTGQR